MEAALYERVWEHPQYRTVAPGESLAYKFVEIAKPDGRVIDFGCGTGRGAGLIHALANVPVLGLDFASNCMDEGIQGVEFRVHDLRKPLGETAPYGYCTDVLEHIAPGDVDAVLQTIGLAARRVYFSISTVQDVMGALVGEPLHLTVESPFWWHDKLKMAGYRIDRSDYGDGWVTFYASMYQSVEDLAEHSALNVEHEQIKDNIKRNLSLGLQELVPHAVQDTLVYLIAGGPSLADYEDIIIEAGRAGVPCVTMNGTYHWLLNRGIRPAVQVMVDARKFNRRFVEPLVDTCKYLISSQCDHEVLKSLPADQVVLWHSSSADPVREALQEAGGKDWYPVYGGSTVACSALVLLAMLGFRRVEVFGLDSCLRDGDHHAYAQPENDGEHVVEFTVGGRKFLTTGWMAIQARDIQVVIRNVLSKIPDFEMIVHGDGLIAHILQTAAEKAARSN